MDETKCRLKIYDAKQRMRRLENFISQNPAMELDEARKMVDEHRKEISLLEKHLVASQ